MAKTKKKLMIPFTYYYEQMLDYCNYYYEEGTENSNKIWWDTLENKAASVWTCKPDKENYWTKVSNPNYETELIEYNNTLNEIQERKDSGRYVEVDAIVWKENYEFEDTLVLTGMSRGRSAANFNLKSETDSKDYNLFMTDIVDMIKMADINKGKVKGLWTFVKRGQNYGIKLIEQKD